MDYPKFIVSNHKAESIIIQRAKLVLTCCFSGGFFLLPFLWVVNSIWFFKEAFFKPAYEEQKQIKTCKFHLYSKYRGSYISSSSFLCLKDVTNTCKGMQCSLSSGRNSSVQGRKLEAAEDFKCVFVIYFVLESK